jgi:hypothetical protein
LPLRCLLCQVSLSGSRFSLRTFFAGGIYTSGSTDYIMVLGGRGAPNANDGYGYFDSNDVWQSTTGGATWTMLTAKAAWAPRDQFAWTRSSSTGLQVIMGGTQQGGYADFFGDLWTSTDGANWFILDDMTSLGEQSLNELIFDGNNYLYFFGGQANPPQYTLVHIGAKSLTPLVSSGAAPAPVKSVLDFNYYANASTGLGGVGQAVAPLLAPLTLNSVTYPVGSFIVWGAQENTAVVPIISNAAVGSVIPYVGPSSSQPGSGNSDGCAQRFGGNRFYEIGTFGDPSRNFTSNTYFVLVSTDGINWPNVLDNATTAAWLKRNNEDNTMCVVDMNNNVISVGQEDTWMSSNGGVTFTQVSTASALCFPLSPAFDKA